MRIVVVVVIVLLLLFRQCRRRTGPPTTATTGTCTTTTRAGLDISCIIHTAHRSSHWWDQTADCRSSSGGGTLARRVDSITKRADAGFHRRFQRFTGARSGRRNSQLLLLLWHRRRERNHDGQQVARRRRRTRRTRSFLLLQAAARAHALTPRHNRLAVNVQQQPSAGRRRRSR